MTSPDSKTARAVPAEARAFADDEWVPVPAEARAVDALHEDEMAMQEALWGSVAVALSDLNHERATSLLFCARRVTGAGGVAPPPALRVARAAAEVVGAYLEDCDGSAEIAMIVREIAEAIAQDLRAGIHR